MRLYHSSGELHFSFELYVIDYETDPAVDDLDIIFRCICIATDAVMEIHRLQEQERVLGEFKEEEKGTILRMAD